jgi:hypothetical protein
MVFNLIQKQNCSSICKELNTVEYMNRLGNIIHKEEEVLEDQRRGGRTGFRSRDGLI